jgi:hypothetical protein
MSHLAETFLASPVSAKTSKKNPLFEATSLHALTGPPLIVSSPNFEVFFVESLCALLFKQE